MSSGLSASRPRPASPNARRAPSTLVLAVGAVVLLALLAAVVATAFSGAADPLEEGLTDAGPGVRWALPLVRVVHDLAASLTFGALLLVATLAPGKRVRAEGLQLAAVAGFVWAVAGFVGVNLWFADASGLPLTQPGFGAEFASTVWSLDALRIGLISSGAALVAATGAALSASRGAAVFLTVVAGFGIVVLGLAGHAGGSADHETAVNAMAAHMLSAAVWVGGLGALLVLSRSIGSALPVVARRYSTLALWAFVALAVSGVMAASTRFASFADLATGYGVLVIVKTLALVVLGVAGWWHRRTTLARLDEGGDRARGAFARLALAEVALMAVTFGVATSLARTEPPVPETVENPSAALALTGFPVPPAPTAMSWLTAWRVEWLFLATALLAIALYAAGVVRLVRRGDRWPVGRTVNWVVGWLLFIWATNGFLGIYGRVTFSWHMTIHMVEAMLIPIFLVLGAPVTLALRTLRPRRDGTLGPRELLLGLVHSRYLKVVGNPVFAGAFFFLSLVIFYWTGLFELALTTHTGHLLMTAHFVLAGYFFAWVLIGVDPGPKRWSPALRLVVLFATISFHAFFGVAIVSGTTLLAPDFFTTVAVPWVPDPLVDQQNGGSIAWAIGELPTLALALIVAVQWARADDAESRRRDRRADRDEDAELTAYNAHLARLGARGGRQQQD